MNKYARSVIATVMGGAMMVGAAAPASALTWQDIVDYFKGGGSSESTTTTTPDTPATSESQTATDQESGEVGAMLASLRDAQEGQSPESVVPENDTGYVREDYMKDWIKLSQQDNVSYEDYGPAADRLKDNCSVRQAILIRDGEGVQVDGSCKPIEGHWEDLYGSGKTWDPSNVSQMDIDHVVALDAVHRAGGHNMDSETKNAIAMDPLNLLAVDRSLNRSKGSQDANTWLPIGDDAICFYVDRQIRVKDKYDLSVTGAERTTLQEKVESCGL